MAVATMDNGPEVPKEMLTYMHCSRCIKGGIPRGQSPASWARLSVGVTKNGLQVWCERHDINVALFEWAAPTDKLENPEPLKIECGVCKEQQ